MYLPVAIDEECNSIIYCCFIISITIKILFLLKVHHSCKTI